MNKKVNQKMATHHNLSVHHPWAGQYNENGDFRVTDSHGKRSFHPYTRKDASFHIDKYGKSTIKYES